jgi:hypothetical protein
MFDLAKLTEFGLAGFTLAGFIAVSKWFLAALDKKDKLIGTIVDKHEGQRERENERHDKSYSRLSEAINDLTVEIARKK